MNDSLNARLQHALQLQKAGHVGEAIGVYQAILAIDANHFDVLQMLGVALERFGQSENGARLLARAHRLAQESFS